MCVRALVFLDELAVVGSTNRYYVWSSQTATTAAGKLHALYAQQTEWEIHVNLLRGSQSAVQNLTDAQVLNRAAHELRYKNEKRRGTHQTCHFFGY